VHVANLLTAFAVCLTQDSEARLALLRGRDESAGALDAPPVASSSSSRAALPEDPFYATQPDGERRAIDRKGKARAGKGDDMRALDRLLLSGGSSSSSSRPAAATTRAASGDESLSFYGKDGAQIASIARSSPYAMLRSLLPLQVTSTSGRRKR
jgi:hypothetical protein